MASSAVGAGRRNVISAIMGGQRRYFYGWLVEVFNRRDTQRIKEVGPDRAAAEWMLRNGGKVKFAKSITWLSQYGGVGSQDHKLTAIDASGIQVTNSGLQHLIGLKHLRHLDLKGCEQISELETLTEVADTLEYLDISFCTGVSDVAPLIQLKNLKDLIITGTLGGTNRSRVIDTLEQKLTSCKITD